MVQIVYQPEPHDNDETEVAGIAFKAYEPSEIDDRRFPLISRLLGNPWFAKVGEVNQERKAKWEKVREAQAMAAQHHAFAEKVVEEAEKHAAGQPAEAQVKAPAGSSPPSPSSLH